MSSRERAEKIARENRQAQREELFKLIAEKVEKLGYECVHVGLNNAQSSGLSIQILIDSIGGINLSDCETVSKAVNSMLDKIDKEKGELPGVVGRYYLEVSSPGIERPLFTPEHYRRFQNSDVRIRLAEALEGRKNLTGKIIEADDDCVKIYLDDEERDMTVPFKIIKSGNLKIDLNKNNLKNNLKEEGLY